MEPYKQYVTVDKQPWPIIVHSIDLFQDSSNQYSVNIDWELDLNHPLLYGMIKVFELDTKERSVESAIKPENLQKIKEKIGTQLESDFLRFIESNKETQNDR